MGLSAVSTAVSGTLSERVEFIEASERTSAPTSAGGDDLLREVYAILGLPIDAVDMPEVLSSVRYAAARRKPFLLSTPNLNFLVHALTDSAFRDTILSSDLCPPDGMPIVWMARLMGLPIRRRVAGSDIFDALMTARDRQPLKVFLFGGAEGVAAKASRTINRRGNGVRCVGSLCPGFGSVEDLSKTNIIQQINASDADFVVASLGALKGQLWLHRNHARLGAPVRAHFGAVVNFQASTVKRAPAWLKSAGLEWLWRIKEEPHLWQRYLHDGVALLRLLFTHIIPLAAGALWMRYDKARDFRILRAPMGEFMKVTLVGAATAQHITTAVASLRDLSHTKAHVLIDVSHTRWIDARFFGLLLMLRRQLTQRGAQLKFTGVSPRLERIFRLNGVGYLLNARA